MSWRFIEAAESGSWRGFVIAFLLTLAVGVVAIMMLILIADPYDSGRFGVEWNVGIVDESPRTADVSRGRDLNFNAAVIGDSRGQLLDPKRLSAGTGWNFVQLSVPGSRPREQLAILRWFLQHHDGKGAVVLTADDAWCTEDPALPLLEPFPFWLYGSDLDYAVHALRGEALDRFWRRAMLAAGRRTASDPAGYWDYEIGRVWHFAPPEPPAPVELASLTPRAPQRIFPAIKQLEALLASSNGQVPLVMIFPPVFAGALPLRESAEAETTAQCKGALAALAQRYGAFLDFLVDGDVARDPMNFMDQTHYRARVARRLEDAITAAFAAQRQKLSAH